MPPTPPPQKTVADARIQKSRLVSKLVRMGVSFLLGIVAFLALLVISGNKSVNEVVDMVAGLL